MLRLVGAHRWCSVRAGLTDRELAGQLAAADLFILATRTRSGRRPTGEGFGLVLLEAQLAGTPVVGPAHGGSRDAYAETTTGLTPTDESATALAGVLDSLLKDPGELRRMGARAADWARERFAPEKYAPLVVARLL
jgi:phosphatidyl-myo-inositol dimannoside synthase